MRWTDFPFPTLDALSMLGGLGVTFGGMVSMLGGLGVAFGGIVNQPPLAGVTFEGIGGWN